ADDHPEEPYLYPEFVLARQLFLKAGLDAVIADARQLRYGQDMLLAGDLEIGMVYNHLVDFALARPEHAALNAAYREGAVVMTPNPHSHALIADKRNLTLLSDPAALEALGVPAELRSKRADIPQTVLVTPENADLLSQSRKNLFFQAGAVQGRDACPPIEDVSAADQILDLVAHDHDECPVFCPGPVHRAQASWASPLGISSGHQVANDAKTISGTTGKSRD
ncbi:MAG: hypothetical protein K0M60_14075, partial [Hydrogenophaga sp.]|nr:hypothetical protein [Hydrogenophaga sp.]